MDILKLPIAETEMYMQITTDKYTNSWRYRNLVGYGLPCRLDGTVATVYMSRLDGTVAARLRYRLDGTVASAR